MQLNQLSADPPLGFAVRSQRHRLRQRAVPDGVVDCRGLEADDLARFGVGFAVDEIRPNAKVSSLMCVRSLTVLSEPSRFFSEKKTAPKSDLGAGSRLL